MRRSLLGLSLSLAALAVSACDSSTSASAEPLSADEQTLVGSWTSDPQGAHVVFELRADRTQKNNVHLGGKLLFEAEGTWHASNGMAYFTNTKCRGGDSTDAPCGIVSDTTRIDVTNGQWTINSTSTGHAPYIFTKQ